MVDRRRHYRTECRIAACIGQRGLVRADQHCHTANIGMKGAFLPNAPKHPVGSYCELIIHDNASSPLRVKAIVAHATKAGIGFTFTQPQIDDCLRLKHLVKPHWDGKSFLDGMILLMRYSQPATELKDVLSLTSMLSIHPEAFFTRQPHSRESCPISS